MYQNRVVKGGTGIGAVIPIPSNVVSRLRTSVKPPLWTFTRTRMAGLQPGPSTSIELFNGNGGTPNSNATHIVVSRDRRRSLRFEGLSLNIMDNLYATFFFRVLKSELDMSILTGPRKSKIQIF